MNVTAKELLILVTDNNLFTKSRGEVYVMYGELVIMYSETCL